MNFSQMKSSLRQKLNESGSTFYSDEDVADAINEAYAEVSDATEFYERQATIQLLTGRTYYDLTTLLDSDTFLSPRRAFNPATNRWFQPTDYRDLDTHTYVQWELTEAAPRDYFLRGNWWFGVWPKSNDDTSYHARLYYTAIAPPLVEDTDVPQFPVQWHAGIVEIAFSDLLTQERETEKALDHWKIAMTYIDQLADYAGHRQDTARQDIL